MSPPTTTGGKDEPNVFVYLNEIFDFFQSVVECF